MFPNDLAGRLDPRGNVNRGDEYSELDAYAYLRKQLHQRAANDRRWLGHGDRVPDYKPEAPVPSSDNEQRMYELNKRNAEAASKNANYNYDVLEAINPHEAHSTMTSEMSQLLNKFGPAGAGLAGAAGGGVPGAPPGGGPPGPPRGPDGQPLDLSSLSEADRNQLSLIQSQGGSVTQRNIAARRIRVQIQEAVEVFPMQDASKNELMAYFTGQINRHIDRFLAPGLSIERVVALAYARSGLWMIEPNVPLRARTILEDLLRNVEPESISIKLGAARSILKDIQRQMERGRLNRVNYLDSRSDESILSPGRVGETALWVYLTQVAAQGIMNLVPGMRVQQLLRNALHGARSEQSPMHVFLKILQFLEEIPDGGLLRENPEMDPDNILMAHARDGSLVFADLKTGVANIRKDDGGWSGEKKLDELQQNEKEALDKAIADLGMRLPEPAHPIPIANDEPMVAEERFPQDEYGAFEKKDPRGPFQQNVIGVLEARYGHVPEDIKAAIDVSPDIVLQRFALIISLDNFHDTFSSTLDPLAFQLVAQLHQALIRSVTHEGGPAEVAKNFTGSPKRLGISIEQLLKRTQTQFNDHFQQPDSKEIPENITRFVQSIQDLVMDFVESLNGAVLRQSSARPAATRPALELSPFQTPGPAPVNLFPPGSSQAAASASASPSSSMPGLSPAPAPAPSPAPVRPDPENDWIKARTDETWNVRRVGSSLPKVRDFIRRNYPNPAPGTYQNANGDDIPWGERQALLVYPDISEPEAESKADLTYRGEWIIAFNSNATMPLRDGVGPNAKTVYENLGFFLAHSGQYALPGADSLGAGLQKRKSEPDRSDSPSLFSSLRGRGSGRSRGTRGRSSRGRGSENYIIKDPEENSGFHPPPVPRPGVRPRGRGAGPSPRPSRSASPPASKKSKVNNPAYGPFGNKFISTPHLESREVRMVYGTGRAVPGFPKRAASPELVRCIHDVVHGGSVSADSFHKLNSDDRAYFNKMAKSARLSQTGKHNHMAKQDHDALERLAVLCGMRENGNDSAEVKDEIKRLVKFCSDQSLLTRARATKILAWIA